MPESRYQSQAHCFSGSGLVALFAMYYNFVRIHKTLRTTPAMAAMSTTVSDIKHYLRS